MITHHESTANQCPPELLSLICAHIFAAGLPPAETSLDPLITSEDRVPTALPSTYPGAQWSEPTVRKTLASATLVNHAWYEAAKPHLWKSIEVRLPRSWLTLVEELVGGDEEEILDSEHAAEFVGQTIQDAQDAALAAQTVIEGSPCVDNLAQELHLKLLATLAGPDGHIPPELLSPPATRDPSPRRLRAKSKSPARWKLMRTISDAMQDVMEQQQPGVYVPTLQDPHPGRFVRHLDFTHFRTIGMRRSIEEGVTGRFVTSERLLAVLKEMPNLVAFGGTEYMDSALTLEVLQELLLRGGPSRGRGRPSRGRGLVVVDHSNPEEEDRERRRDYQELEALDLTGCVSAVFAKAMHDFVTMHLLPPPQSGNTSRSDGEDGARERGRVRFAAVDESLTFPAIQRLSVRGMKSIPAQILEPFILAFPSLTHLDLSCTRVTPALLSSLGTSPTIRLKGLGLERCNWLTGESIRKFLVESPVTADLEGLSLYGDWTFPSPLSEEDMSAILAKAPCFRSGKLVYLDISSTPVTREILLSICAEQPNLRSLGMSYIRRLELDTIAAFLKTKARNVEALTLGMTSPDLGYADQFVPPRQATIALHTKIIGPLCTAPFSFSLSSPRAAPAQPPTRLRVLELAPQMLTSLGGGAGSWRIVRSKGSRGWYVDSASAWVADDVQGSVLRRDLEKGHPWREEVERLANANGNVSNAVGWHSRKMEILRGHGFLGREAGLYGAVSFAYAG
ncbi:uncharacterized protein PHACADRAFT_139912 [Phanerochaete carnosa HHB-10118-sp]|uniref:Uncharacterized protein n=1 Tax=Phanerochaete carnosa (strain HHB-10118-sp) TaxID=650164 RepID=K5X5S7_PHACS|nr:uncharacterized protein PHACADRAFT_139912 [Phanerochaete carnosa HHB-10118-sp]EKM58207.1 hypothetical protein PHACADRAFT_139912 [Phanerochaete carnosa HHB-10118-sp]